MKLFEIILRWEKGIRENDGGDESNEDIIDVF
jgi:hypothetical protein